MTRTARLTAIVGVLGVLGAASAAAQAPRTVRAVGADRDLATLTLVKSDQTRAVVRFGGGALELIARGDRVGSSAAVVKEVTAGRLVLELEQTKRADDGRPIRAVIVLKDGETAGTRYHAELTETAPPAVRPLIVK